MGDSDAQKNNSTQYRLTIDGDRIESPEGLDWHDTKIKFKIPAKQLNGKPWQKGQKILIGVIVGGRESNTLPFAVTTDDDT